MKPARQLHGAADKVCTGSVTSAWGLGQGHQGPGSGVWVRGLGQGLMTGSASSVWIISQGHQGSV